MPLIIPRELPAYRALSDENVFVMHRTSLSCTVSARTARTSARCAF